MADDDQFAAVRLQILENLQKHLKDKPPGNAKEFKEALELLEKVKPKETDEETALSVEVKALIEGMTAKIYTQDMEDLCLENKELRAEVKLLQDYISAQAESKKE